MLYEIESAEESSAIAEGREPLQPVPGSRDDKRRYNLSSESRKTSFCAAWVRVWTWQLVNLDILFVVIMDVVFFFLIESRKSIAYFWNWLVASGPLFYDLYEIFNINQSTKCTLFVLKQLVWIAGGAYCLSLFLIELTCVSTSGFHIRPLLTSLKFIVDRYHCYSYLFINYITLLFLSWLI